MEENKQYRVLMEGEKEDPDGYLDSFPPGYRFCPTDEELIIHYLKPKNLNQSVPISCIKTVDVYEYSPQELTEIFKLPREEKWYFFTQLNTSFKGATGLNQKAGNGCWKNDRRAEEKIYSDGHVVVYKRGLLFVEEESGIKTDWRMKAYKYCKESDSRTRGSANVKPDDWFLCEIYKTKFDMAKRSEKNNLQQDGGIMSTRVPDGVPNTGPEMQNEDPLQLTLCTRSSGLQNSSSKISAYGEYTEEQNSFWDSLPPGYRFCPTDEELIVHYVKPKRLIQDLPNNRIPIGDPYTYHPQDLTEIYKPLRENEWYFFATTKLKHGHGKFKDRIGFNGYWKIGKEDPINSNGRRIGSRRSLTFYEDKLDQSTATKWLMNEYKLDQESSPTCSMVHREMGLTDWILCKIHNCQPKEEEKKKKKKPNKVPMMLFL